MPGPPHRRVPGRPGQDRLPHGAADPRATHPPGEGDQQHLHRPGAAGGDRQHVRRLPRPPRAAGHRRAGGRPGGRAGPRPGPAGLQGEGPAPSSTPSGSTRPPSAVGRILAAAEARGHELAPAGARRADHQPRRDHHPRRRRGPAGGVRRRPTRPRASRRWPARPACRLPPALRRHERLPHPPGLQHATTPRPRCCATSAGSRRKDISLTRSMIPLGSCTMKLNATAEMMPVTWPEWGRLHPFAPPAQAEGYQTVFRELERALASHHRLRRRSRCSPTPARRASSPACWSSASYHESRGEGHRDVCLIPTVGPRHQPGLGGDGRLPGGGGQVRRRRQRRPAPTWRRGPPSTATAWPR